MTETTNPLKDRVLDHDDDLRDVVELLLQRANQRQMWLMFMDERGCLGDPLMPMNDYPADPNYEVDIDDLGTVTEAHVLMHRAGLLREMTGNASIVLAWERIGTEMISDDDRNWARAMAEASRLLDVPLRAQFIVHARGVRQLHPDDYL
ncbi:MAG TPA: hypothetical protein DIW46_07175 [Microbacterium sp.]|uniref:hypothetical protein n=1 Tax=Microbacterium sp. TaxID=51671 RepID=UPI000EC41D5A|nr:hypothetical protein [Microbacterium sp.]